jgi:DNA polymerase III delta prime subunit
MLEDSMNKTLINEILNAPVPTRLLVGPLEKIQDLTELAIRSEFCEQKNIEQVENCFCIQCRKIKNRQHPFLVWINPEKNYSIDDVQIIFDHTKFALDANQKFFFVLDKASELNVATANKLLKILEEPCEGYKFILLADNVNKLPATVISRSHIIKISDDRQLQEKNPLLKFFTTQTDPITFDQEIKKTTLSEQECVELCYELIEYFFKKSKEENTANYKKKLEMLQKRLQKPPCPGSSNLFLKLLYLDLSQI